ncbi:MAG: aldose epimerase [Chloroflexota bacterium]|nr:aldose epimerase [Chloroflexota bacterium]
MPPTLYTLENEHWQVGILPETGGSTAFGRVRVGDRFEDVMRPTAEADYGNASLCASFIMLPWANRLRDAKFSFEGVEYVLEASSADGTAIHGTVRKLPWRVVSADALHVRLMFDSSLYEKLNYPFEFSAEAEYRLEGGDFVMTLALRNEDTRAIPAGFGHHPYFLRAPGGDANAVQLEIPCDQQYTLHNALATAPPQPISAASDYRTLKPLDDAQHDDLLTARHADKPMRMVYPAWGVELAFHADALFEHVLLFAPVGKPFFALEPQTNANDGFNLRAQGIAPAGVFVLQPGESRRGECRLQVV